MNIIEELILACNPDGWEERRRKELGTKGRTLRGRLQEGKLLKKRRRQRIPFELRLDYELAYLYNLVCYV